MAFLGEKVGWVPMLSVVKGHCTATAAVVTTSHTQGFSCVAVYGLNVAETGEACVCTNIDLLKSKKGLEIMVRASQLVASVTTHIVTL